MLLGFWHGCSGNRKVLEHDRYYDFGMDLKHERYYDFGVDALVIVCFRNTNVIMFFGMDALVIVRFRNTNVIMILAWMLW